MADVTDYDVWHDSESPVTVEMVVQTLQKNTQIAQNAIGRLVRTMDEWAGDFPAHHTLKDAIITNHGHISAQRKRELAPLVGKYLE